MSHDALGFDVESACNIIIQNNYSRIALQFPDEFIQHSLSCYIKFKDLLKVNKDIFIYIITDSTYGNSVDDISAQHIDADLLVYLGNDINASSSIPLLILPYRKHIQDNHQFISSLYTLSNQFQSIIICPNLSYYDSTIHQLHSSGYDDQCTNLIIAQLPSCADTSHWKPHESVVLSNENNILIGGLIISKQYITSSTLIIYIGNNSNQLLSIQLKMSSNSIQHYNPDTQIWLNMEVDTSKQYQQRYGAISRVSESRIIGIIIGSMGLTSDITRVTTDKIQRLIRASGKQFYTFVMGRLNEAKLCNFPDVDIFCLIGNDDVSIVKPKTFPVPIITPYELEVGLGCRPWTDSIETSIQGLMMTTNMLTTEAMVETLNRQRELDIDDVEEVSYHGSDILLTTKREGELTSFTSAAADAFMKREYQGVLYESEGGSTEIHNGLHGTAQSYRRKN